mgnify:CR=1 FL=1
MSDTISIDVTISSAEYESARERAIENGFSSEYITLIGDVILSDALEEATVDQLRDQLGRELPGYTPDQLTAIEACFSAALAGEISNASALLPRIFEHAAQIDAAERAIHASHFRSIAA